MTTPSEEVPSDLRKHGTNGFQHRSSDGVENLATKKTLDTKEHSVLPRPERSIEVPIEEDNSSEGKRIEELESAAIKVSREESGGVMHRLMQHETKSLQRTPRASLYEDDDEADAEAFRRGCWRCWEFVKSRSLAATGILFSFSLLSLAIVLIYFHNRFYRMEMKMFAGSVAWFRVLFYFGMLVPLWYLSFFIVLWFLAGANKLVDKGKPVLEESEDSLTDYRTLKSSLVFMKRFKRSFARLFFSCFLSGLWSTVFSGNDWKFVPGEDLPAFERSYGNILRLHFVVIMYFLGRIISHYCGFTFLHRYNAKHFEGRIDESLFQQALLVTLCGGIPSTSSTLIPNELFATKIKPPKHILQQEATRYVLGSRLEKILAYDIGLATEKSDIVVSEGTKRIVATLRAYENKVKTSFSKPSSVNPFKFVGGETQRKEVDSGKISMGRTNKAALDSVRSVLSSDSQSYGKSKGVHLLDMFKRKNTGRSNSTLKEVGDRLRSRNPKLRKEILIGFLKKMHGEKINIVKALETMDLASSELISTRDIRNFVELAVANRKNLIVALRDSRMISAQVKGWFSLAINLLALFGGLLVCIRANVLETLISLSSFALGFSFIFGHSIQELFENVVFLYGSHPYDVGDVIRLGPEGSLYMVQRVLLHTTELESIALESRTIQNSTIRSIEPLYNMTQSKSIWMTIKFILDVDVLTVEFHDKVSKDFDEFIKSRPDIYRGWSRVDCFDFLPPLKVQLVFGFDINFPCVDWGPVKRVTNVAAIAAYNILKKHAELKYTAHIVMDQFAKPVVA